MGNLEVLFYNALLVLVPAVLVSAITGDLEKAYYYEHWNDVAFIVTFSLSGIMGLVIHNLYMYVHFVHMSQYMCI